MSDVIDTNVVEMRFDNAQFVRNVSQTIEVVDQLKESLKFDSDSFDSLTRASNNIDLSRIADGVESLSDRFSGLGIVGMTAIQRITNEVMTLAGKLGSLVAKPWQQIITGGTSRAANIAQAKFQLEGLFGKTELGADKLAMTMSATAEEVAKITGYTEDLVVAMDAANYAVADTAYGLDSAAKAASVLATSGVDVLNFREDLKDASGLMRTEMQVALRGISGVAAMTNASYDEIAHTFERVAGNGRVMAIDLQSFSARGLNAAATIRDYLNEIGETANATEADIRDMVSKGQISFLTLAKAMDSAYGDHAKDANNTFTGALGNMKFALSKIGADFIAPLRNNLIPIFNDLRLSINNVRKALNFKMKFPGLEEEVSIVELFTRVVTNLSNKLHDMFIVWHGGQDVLERAMSGFASATGTPFETVKNVFDAVKNGAQSSKGAINQLTLMASSRGEDLSEVYKQLGETFDKTDDEIREMCRNGEISFEEFYNALSAVFGNNVADKRISQFALLFQNVLRVVINFAKTVATIVGPVLEAFFDVFLSGTTVNGIVDLTTAFANFTEKLRLSQPTQRKLVEIMTKVFKTIKTLLGVVKVLAKAIFTLIDALAPLLSYVLDFVSILVTIVATIVEVIASSDLFRTAIEAVTKVLQVAGYIILNVLTIALSLVGPLLSAVGALFVAIAKGIGTINLSFLNLLIDRIKELARIIVDGTLIQTIENAIKKLGGMLEAFFTGLVISFAFVNELFMNFSKMLSNLGNRILDILKKIGNTVKKIFDSIYNFFTDPEAMKKAIEVVEQVLGYAILIQFGRFLAGLIKVVNGFGNKLNVENMKQFSEALRNIALSILFVAGALVLISSIPTNQFWRVLLILGAIAIAIGGIVAVYYAMRANYIKALNAGREFNTLTYTMQQFLGQLSISLNNFIGVVHNFLQGVSKALNKFGLAAIIISIAASIYVLVKAIMQLKDEDWEVILEGIGKVALIMSVLAIGVITLMLALDHFNKATGGGLAGAAIAMLGFAVTIKLLKNVLLEYAAIDPMVFAEGWRKVTLMLITVSATAALLASQCKKSGTAMMQTAIVMLAYIVVLKAMKQILLDYVDMFGGKSNEEIVRGLVTIAGVLAAFAGAIYLISKAVGTADSALTASLKGGLNFSRNGVKLMGAVMTIFALVVALKAVGSLMKDIQDAGMVAYAATLVLVLATMFGVVKMFQALATANLKGAAASIFALTAMIFGLATVMSVMTLFNTYEMIAAAGCLTLVVAALGYMISGFQGISSGSTSSIVTSLTFLTVFLYGLTGLFDILSVYDWKTLISASVGLSLVIKTVVQALYPLSDSTLKFNKDAVASLIAILVSVTTALTIASNMSIASPASILSMAAGISALSIALGLAGKLLNQIKIDSNTANQMIKLAAAIGILGMFLAVSANAFTGKETAILALSIGLDLLIPLIYSMAAITAGLAKVPENLQPGVLALTEIMGIIAAFTALIALVAWIPNGGVENTVTLLDGLGFALLKLVPFVAVCALVSAALGALFTSTGGIGAAAFGAGLIGLGAIMLGIAAFVAFIALDAWINDVNDTVTLLSALGPALTSLIPFVITLELLCTVLGIATPLLLAGVVGFRALALVIAAFVAAIARVAMIGDVNNTVYLLENLVSSMDKFGEFLKSFMVVLTLIGAGAIFTAAGIFMFSLVLKAITNFVEQLTSIGQTGDVAKTVLLLTALSNSMAIMSDVMKTLIVVGALAPVALIGFKSMITVIKSFIVLASAFAILSGLRNIIETGVEFLLELVQTLAQIVNTMNFTSYNTIKTFVAGVELLGRIDISNILKFMTASTLLLAATLPIKAIGKAKKSVELGLSVLRSMFDTFEYVSEATLRISKNAIDGIVDNYKKIAEVSEQMSKYAGKMSVSGLLTGLFDSESMKSLRLAGMGMAYVFHESFCDYMGIHSDSDEFIEDGHYSTHGLLTGCTDIESIGNITDAATFMSELFGDTANTGFVNAGEQGADSYIQSFMAKLGMNVKEGSFADQFLTTLENSDGNIFYQRVDKGDIIRGKNTTPHHGESSGTANNANQHEGYWSPTLNSIANEEFKEKDYGDWIDDFLKMINESQTSLTSLDEIAGYSADSLDGLGSSMDGVGKSSDSLSNKIDNLMDRYEKRFETAKERANKDLFKGVDEQGDDFLDKVKDIMDEYAKIYENAVEKTNSQDLFAEVNEEDASFAPETLLHNLEDQVNQINELNTIISSLSGRIADKNLAAAISNMDVDDLPQLRALYRMNAGQLAEYEQMYQRKVQANQNKIQNELSGSLSQLTGSTVNVASYVATDASTTRLVRNLEAQINQLNEYNDTVASLMTRIKDVHLREAIATMGVESIDELKALNSMTDAQLDEYVALYNRKITAGMSSVTNELSAELSALLGEPIDISDFYAQYDAGLYQVADTIASGSSGGAKAVADKTGEQIAEELNNSVINSVDDDAAYEAGKSYVEAIGRGMADSEAIKYLQTSMDGIMNMIAEDFYEYYNYTEHKDTVTEAGANIIVALIDGIASMVEDNRLIEVIESIPNTITKKIDDKHSQFIQVGKNIVLGIREGMMDPTVIRSIEAAATAVVNRAILTARAKLKIKSPSRVFMQIGKYLDEGFAIGIRDYAGLAEDEAGSMATGSVNAVQDTISRLSGMLDGSIDVNPVITPTLDLSEVNSKSAALANMFNGRQIAVQAQNDEQQTAMMSKLGDIIAEQNSEPRSITFNQTNNSPKALSRQEIYRQSRNAFSQLASAVT